MMVVQDISWICGTFSFEKIKPLMLKSIGHCSINEALSQGIINEISIYRELNVLHRQGLGVFIHKKAKGRP